MVFCATKYFFGLLVRGVVMDDAEVESVLDDAALRCIYGSLVYSMLFGIALMDYRLDAWKALIRTLDGPLDDA